MLSLYQHNHTHLGFLLITFLHHFPVPVLLASASLGAGTFPIYSLLH